MQMLISYLLDNILGMVQLFDANGNWRQYCVHSGNNEAVALY